MKTTSIYTIVTACLFFGLLLGNITHPTPSHADESDEVDLVRVYFPLLFNRVKAAPTVTPTPTRTPTATPTRAPTATPTKTPLPAVPSATPGSGAGVKPSYPTPAPRGDCLPSDPNYRDKGGNGPYKFCVAEDLNWVNVPHAASVQRFAAGTDKWMTLQWNVYGINAIRLAADPSSSIANCGAPGRNGFGKPVNGNGNYTFNLRELGAGQYKFELFITRSDGVIVGHNEVFVCLT